MTAYTDFHYSPTGSGVISGAQVLEQTEQGINGLGQYVQDNVSGAIDTANQALTIAQTADSNATLALNTANSFASAISAANNTANNALTTAQSAQNTANSASSLATTANNNANTALNAANTATANVGTLTNSVNALGNRMTTAENAISTNAGNITTLQTNLQTTNNNVTAAANAASAAQATATSAQGTATLARNQAYVLRYTGTTITGGGTIAYADIDNTDNIKSGDKIIDVTGDIYRIASVDIANETVTVDASDVIHLANDSDVVHKTGDETVGGIKTFTKIIKNQSENLEIGVIPSSNTDIGYRVVDKNNTTIANLQYSQYTSGNSQFALSIRAKDNNNNIVNKSVMLNTDQYGTWFNFRPSDNSSISLGSTNYRWSAVYSDSYYYGTTAWGLDKANVWTGTNTFQQNIIYERTNFFHQTNNPCYFLKDTGLEKGSLAPTIHSAYTGNWQDKNGDNLGYVRFVEYDTGKQTAEIRVSNLIKNGALDPTGSAVACTVHLVLQPSGEKSLVPEQNNDINLGTSTNKWKSLNGINPGALSLPDVATTWEDITGYVLDGTTENSFPISGVTALDGWLQCRVKHTLGTASFLRMEMSYRTWTAQDKDCIEEYTLWVPVKAGTSFNKVICLADDLKIRFHPCLGNV